jgi:hypothetical protein
MIARLRSFLKSGLFALGYNLSRHTSSAAIKGLLSKLRPMDCGIELIRIGSDMDGGYLVPDDLEGIEYCFSPGVSTDSDFEDHLARQYKIKSFLADYSVDAPPIHRPEFIFDKNFLGCSERDPFITMQFWKDKYLKGYNGDLILQMDIEGGEYEVLCNAPDSLLDQFRILAIEFHSLDRLFDHFGFEFLSACFEKLLQFFYVVHIHPNNCCGSVKKGDLQIPLVMEFTFLNKKRVQAVKPQRSFPHKLDREDVPGEPLLLPRCWYAQE